MITFIWSSSGNNGTVVMDTQWGPYQINSTEKPTFNFEYSDITLIEGANKYFYDGGQTLSEDQINEIKSWVNTLEIDPRFKVAEEGREYFQLLQSSDFYFSVDKYETLTEERKLELKGQRQDARDAIRALEVKYGVV